MKEVRIGIIGVGQIGKSHLHEYSSMDGVTLVGAADLNAEELTRLADHHGIERRFSDFRELLDRGVDIIY